MPAIVSHEDLRAAQKDLLEAKDLNELKAALSQSVILFRIANFAFRIWKAPEQLKREVGESGRKAG